MAGVFQGTGKRFADDLRGGESLAEHGGGDFGNLFALGFERADRDHGRGGSDTNDFLSALRANAPDEHGDIGALTAAVSVEFVKYEEPEVVVNGVADFAFLQS